MLASASSMDAQTLRERAEERYPEFLDELQTMVNVDCGSYSPDGVNMIADRCERRFVEHGWEVERRSHDGEPRLGDLVIGRTPCSTTERPRSVRSASRAIAPEDPASPT